MTQQQLLSGAGRDADRLRALRRTALLDSPAEESFDRLTRLATRVLGVPVALVSLIDEDRQFFKSQCGLPEPWASRRETPLSHSFSRHVVDSAEPLIIEDARAYPRVRDSLAIPEIGMVAYAGIPLVTSEGYTLGSFCAIDTEPRRWTEEEIGLLRDLAGAVTTEIELRLALLEGEARRGVVDLVQGLDAIVWEMDVATSAFTFVSQRAEEILGYPVRRWREEPAFWQDVLLHPDDREWALDVCTSATREARDHVFEYRAVAADGRVVWLRDLVRVVRDAEGRPERLRGVMVDVTEQRQAGVALAREQELRLRAQEEESSASFLADAGALLSSSLDYETTLVHLAQLSVDRIADWCAIDILEADGGLHRIVIAHPDPAKRELAWDLHRRFPPDPGAPTGVHQVLRSRQPELVAELPDELLERPGLDPERHRILRELGLQSYMIVPLIAGGEALGAITFVSEDPEDRYDHGDLRLAQELANRAALAVQNARLYGEAEEARTQVTRILASIADAFFALDDAWRFTYLNAQAEALLQRPRGELLGKVVWEEFPEAVGSPFERMYRQAVRQNRTVRFEEYFPPLEAWFEVQAYPSDGGLSVYFRDVTEQKRAREALRRSEQRYRSLVEATAAIVWNTPATGELVGEQARWGAFTGQSPEEYQGWGWLEAIHPDDRARTAAIWERALESRSMYEAEHRLRRHDGEYRHMLARAVPIVDEHGEIQEWVGTHADLTPLRQAQAALEYQSYITRTITDNATAALFMMDERGRCTYMNPAAEAMTGFSHAEIEDIALHDAIHHHHPDGRPYPMSECPIDRALPEDFSVRAHEDVFIRKDGSFFPVVCAASPIFHDGTPVGTVVEVRDVTEERAAAAERERLILALESERRRLQAIFQEAPAFIATLRGPEHVFESANPAYRQLVGHREILGRPVREALPEVVDQGFVDLLDRVYRSGEPFVGMEVPVVLQREAGGEPLQVFVHFVYQPITDAFGAVSGIFVHGVEVTEMVRARHEVERKAEELSRLARQLEITNRELDQFAYVASHDLKAPLRGIANLSQWIEEDLTGELNPEVRDHLELLRGRVNRMEGLIEGILQYSRAGRVREQPEAVDVGALLEEIVDLIAPPEHVRVEIAEGMPALVTERLPLQQVFMNLIGNAIKYNADEAPWVGIAVREEGPFLEFSVADNGPGIAPEYHERIFGIFQTLAARDKVEGTGIGLSLVKKIVENRGGRVWVESGKGAGATFRFLWPLMS